jgi:predicted esterase
MAEGAPKNVVENDAEIAMPPILITLKEGDTNHPVEMQEAFAEAYRKRGGQVEIHTFADLPEYRMKPSPEEPETMRWLDTVTEFVARHGG